MSESFGRILMVDRCVRANFTFQRVTDKLEKKWPCPMPSKRVTNVSVRSYLNTQSFLKENYILTKGNKCYQTEYPNDKCVCNSHNILFPNNYCSILFNVTET